MAQITDVMDALAVFDAARQELSWAYSGDLPKNLKDAVQTISEELTTAGSIFIMKAQVLNRRHVHRTAGEAESRSIRATDWLTRLKKVAYDMRAVAQKELLEEDCKIDDKLVRARWLRCLPRTTRITRCNPTSEVAEKLEELIRTEFEELIVSSPRLPLAARTEQPFDGGQEENQLTDVLMGRDNDERVVVSNDEQQVCPQEWPGLRENPDFWNNNTTSVFSSSDSQLHYIVGSMSGYCKLPKDLEAWAYFPYCAFVVPKCKGHGTDDLLNQWCSLGITTRKCGVSCILRLLQSRLLLLKRPASNASTVSDGDGSDVKAGGALGLPTRERFIIDKGQIGKEVRGEKEVERVEEEEDKSLLTGVKGFMPDVDVAMDNFTHDFARYLLGDRMIIVDGKNGATPSSSHVNKSVYLALVRNLNAEQSDISSILPPGILALRFEDCREMELSDSAFAFAKYLRLLDLSGCCVKKKLPGSIRHLKQLRYLKAPGIQDEVFPRPITGLHELRYLNLQGSCPLADLTEAFLRLCNLLHLDLSGCSLKELPKSFGRLWMLEHLDLSCSGIEGLPDSFWWLRSLSHLNLSGCSGLKELPESFQRLPRLWHLNLSGCSRLQETGELPLKLRHLDLSCCSGLKEVKIWGKPEQLQHLNMSGCSVLEYSPNLYGMKDLQHVDLSDCSMLKWIYDHFFQLSNLKYLDMSGCLRLEVPENSVATIRRRGGKASGPKDAKLMIDPETSVRNKLRGHISRVDELTFCS